MYPLRGTMARLNITAQINTDKKLLPSHEESFA